MTCGWMMELTTDISFGAGFLANAFGTLLGLFLPYLHAKSCMVGSFYKKVATAIFTAAILSNYFSHWFLHNCPQFFVCLFVLVFFTLTYTVLHKWSLIFQTSPSLFLSLTCVRGAWKAMIIDVTPTRTQCWRLCVSFGNIIMLVITQTMMMIILQRQSLFLTGLDEYLELVFCESSERVGARSAICVASVSFEVYAFFFKW